MKGQVRPLQSCACLDCLIFGESASVTGLLHSSWIALSCVVMWLSLPGLAWISIIEQSYTYNDFNCAMRNVVAMHSLSKALPWSHFTVKHRNCAEHGFSAMQMSAEQRMRLQSRHLWTTQQSSQTLLSSFARYSRSMQKKCPCILCRP